MPENKRLVTRTCQMCGHQFEGTPKKAYCPDCVIVRRNISSLKSYYRSKSGLPNLREVENPGIYVHQGKYHARIVVDGTQYWLGTFADKDLCISMRREAENHIAADDFLSWVETVQLKRHNPTGTPGILPTKSGKFMARISVSGVLRHIDTLPTIEEAIECQKLAQQHVDTGDFDTWLATLKPSERVRVGSSGVSGITSAKDKGWRTTIPVSGRSRYIGTFPTVEEAIAYQKLAQQHIDSGDFDTWVDEIRNPLKGVYQEKNGKWTANIRLNGRRIRVGTFSTADEAAAAATNARATWRICPVCGGPVKDARRTCCSRACAGVYRSGD